jgi:pimeloyl-[acyl-carrier protein] synthase
MLEAALDVSNPYPFYDEKRRQYPVYRGDCGTWYLTRYHDVKMLLSDDRFARRPKGEHGIIHQQTEQTAIDKIIDKWPIYSDPPIHPRIRALLHEIFSARQIKRHREIIKGICETLLADVLNADKIDFMEHFAFPLPVQVINHLLGTEIDLPTAREWSYSLGKALDCGSPEDIKAMTPVLSAIYRYFNEVIQGYIQSPGENWISLLLQNLSAHDITVDDLVSICIFLFVSAYETTQLSLGLGVMTLLKNPGQLALLQENSALVTSAVEEILRYESPVSKLSRWTRQRVTIGNISIPENQLVVGLVNAANHDPERFADPEKFDITRSNNFHLALSYGGHTCQGGILARIELQTALLTLLPHLDRFSLDENAATWLPNTSLRYLYKLMIGIKH